jgi:hypothetical protein
MVLASMILASVILASVILDGFLPMVRSRMAQRIIPIHNFRMLHLGSPHFALPGVFDS